jgi:hypothetical protein
MAQTYPFCCQWGPVTPEGTCGLVDSRPTGNVHCKCRRAGLVLRWAALPLPGPVGPSRSRAAYRAGIMVAPGHELPQGAPRRWRAHVAACPWAAAGATGTRVPSHWHRPGGIMMMMIPLAAGAWPSIPGDGPNWPRHWQLVAASASWRGSG